MLLPSDSWQMLLPFCFGGWCYCPHWIDIILSQWQMLLPYLQVVDGISTFFFFFCGRCYNHQGTVSWADVIANSG